MEMKLARLGNEPLPRLSTQPIHSLVGYMFIPGCACQIPPLSLRWRCLFLLYRRGTKTPETSETTNNDQNKSENNWQTNKTLTTSYTNCHVAHCPTPIDAIRSGMYSFLWFGSGHCAVLLANLSFDLSERTPEPVPANLI